MLFMLIKHFKGGDAAPIGERFRRNGRMLPEDVTYHASWVAEGGTRCFQVMEAPSIESLKPWLSRWDDLVDFEIIPVQSSSDFWSRVQPE